MNEILKSFKDDIGFVRFQINSYNDFVDNRLQKIIGRSKAEIVYKYFQMKKN